MAARRSWSAMDEEKETAQEKIVFPAKTLKDYIDHEQEILRG
jgi:hypothetical protein